MLTVRGSYDYTTSQLLASGSWQLVGIEVEKYFVKII